MGGTRKQRRRSRKIKIDLAEYEVIVKATEERSLSDKERKVLLDAHQILAHLIPFENDETASAILDGDKGNQSAGGDKKPKPRKGSGRRPRSDFPNAKVVKVCHTKVQAGELCKCGCGRIYPLNRPIHFRHFVGQAPIEVTLYELEQLRCNSCGALYTADLPAGVGPSSYDESAVSTIAYGKYGLGTPFYRQALHFATMGTPISVAVQWAVVAEGAEKLEPAHDHMVQIAAQAKVGIFDDTSMPILNFEREEGDERTGLHTTGIVCVHDDFQIALFITGRNHAGENRADLLKKRSPHLPGMIQMSDALSSNLAYISSEELIALCLVHGRRNFVKIVDSFPEECRHVIRSIATVYHHDSLSKAEGHTPEERLAFHQEKSAPVMEDLKEWLDIQILERKVEPNSSLGKAIEYMRSHWEPLTLFLRVADAPLDSNAVERILKKVVLHRKNSLFFKTIRGARVGDIYMSLIKTCELNKVNPPEYLTALQRNHQAVKANPGEWMPWTFRATLERIRGSTVAA
jgi:transposase